MSALKPAPTSSWIAFHGYSNGTMTLITKSGESYAAVMPESRYSDFLKSPSQGSFFNLYIKPFAVVTKVDVTEDVALVEAAKARIGCSGLDPHNPIPRTATATPSPVAVPKKASRKAPAKSLLPHKPAPKGATDAWIDFRCIGDPTTGPGLVKALKRFIELKGKDKENYEHYIPYMGYGAPAGQVEIAALGDWGTGYVNPKYLKAFPEGCTDYKALANAYRAAYRSWVRREGAKKAKVVTKADVLAAAFKEVFNGGFTGTETVTAKVAPSNPVVQVVTVPVGVRQWKVDKALAILTALEKGHFGLQMSVGKVRLSVAQSSTSAYYFDQANKA